MTDKKSRVVGITMAAKFTYEQEQSILDLATEFIKSLYAINPEVEFTFSFDNA